MSHSDVAEGITTISRRFLHARTYLIVALLTLLLALYIGFLLLFMLWDRSEWAHENYADLLRQITRQEYFIGRFAELAPDYICAMASRCKETQDKHVLLPSAGEAAQLNEEFWVLRNGPAVGDLAVAAGAQEKLQQEWLGLGRRLADFQKGFWGYRARSDQSILSNADGSLIVFTQQSPDLAVPQPDAHRNAAFSAQKRHEFERILRDYPDAQNADGVYWTKAMTDPFTGRTVFTCFIPFRNRAGVVIGYVATDMSPDTVLARTRITGNAFYQRAGLVLIYAYTGRLMLIDGRVPTAEEVTFYRNLDSEQEYKYHRSSLQFRPRDAMLQVSYAVPNIEWRVVYAVRLWTLLQDKTVPIGAGILIYLLAVLSVLLGTRQINLAVIGPAARQQKRLADSENFNRTVVETSPVGLAVLRASDCGVIIQNAQFIPLERWRLIDTPEQVLSAKAWSLLLLHTQQSPQDVLHVEDIESGHFYQIGIASAMHDGESVLICVLSDMTDHKRTEQALAEAKRFAESTSASKSLFLATISHEIRTPLYGMLASIELMAKTRLDAGQRQLSHTMDGSARTLKDILNDALDFTKGETEAVEIDSHPFDLTKEVESVVQGFWSRALLKNLELVCLMDPALNGIWYGDALKLIQVLNNLINNAVKFTPSGKVVVTGILLSSDIAAGGERDSASATDKSDHGALRIALSIRDTGPGILEEDMERIFQPFGQASGVATRQQFPGTGLGLFICKKYVAAMGGVISVDSIPGTGTTFVVSIPLISSKIVAVMDDTLRGLKFVINIDKGDAEFAAHLSVLLASKGGRVIATGDDVSDRAGHYARIDINLTESSIPFATERQPFTAGDGSVFLDLSSSYSAFLKHDIGYANPLSGPGIVDAILMVAGRKIYIAEPAQDALQGNRRAINAHVLIVDDQAINRLLLEKQLGYLGCEITAAGSAAQALQLIKDGLQFDLILSDLHMPLMNGYELSLALRARAVTCPIVAVTASALTGERERGLAAGMNGYMIKPFTMEDLEKLLDRHIGSRIEAPGILRDTISGNQFQDDAPDREKAIAEASAIASQMWQPGMLRAAVAGISEDIALLVAAITRADLTYLGEVAHRIHGGMAALDMRPATALCRAIEESAEYEWPEEAFRLAPILQTMLVQIRLDIDPDDD
ncbi:ATP-binding protein [Glaciimonas immobilis]|uniref:histidine kinase n=1 Tax=Glaciimonas immobilis TaxID=728004 RepID=A0A840RXV7_9BURK|nr:ATP-binding protein [Glaciimonas immobilis]KAF3998311.1 response regulator [Glaciimonas immobilis]MBB5201928.1 signal transduction histidine kinase/CheY-like chemotaxis protein/HPt (histidine-containing phosphotransfer) domain-containing protein [Glaciimonas immobilis]